MAGELEPDDTARSLPEPLPASLPTKVAVLGAGVIGLSTAIVLQERGARVTIYSPTLPGDTTSAMAGASFKPHCVVMDERATAMLRRSWTRFQDLIRRDGPGCGARSATHWEASSAWRPRQPYHEIYSDTADVTFPDVPGGYAHGRRYTTVLVDMPVYLQWLLDRFRDCGGTLQILDAPFASLAEAVSMVDTETLINATGLGARELCHDPSVIPDKGQVVRVRATLDRDWSISADGFYIYPRSDDVILGGTNEYGVGTTDVEPAVVDAILRANRRVLPSVSETDVVSTGSALRPYREEGIRLSSERVGSSRVIHQYGHGGAGVTLSWGSAEVAAELAAEWIGGIGSTRP